MTVAATGQHARTKVNFVLHNACSQSGKCDEGTVVKEVTRCTSRTRKTTQGALEGKKGGKGLVRQGDGLFCNAPGLLC